MIIHISPTSATPNSSTSHLHRRQRTLTSQRVHSSLQDRILTDIKQLGLTPKRALGQNFVISQHVLDSIVASAHITQGDAVVEIGPGLGGLTETLLCAGASVLAIEKDDALHAHLQRKFRQVPAVTLVHNDVLSIRDLPGELAIFLGACAGSSRLKVVANIPYSITTDLLRALLPLANTISSMHLLLEDGAARRLTEAKVGDKDYRAMSVFTQYFATARCLFPVSRDMFYPQPHIDSALAEFLIRPHRGKFDAALEEKFFNFVNQAFGMKRKTLVNNLKAAWDQQVLHQCMESTGIPRLSRAEALSVDEYISLFECMTPHAASLL